MKIKKIYMIGIAFVILICVLVTENEAENVTESNNGSIGATAILPLSTETEDDSRILEDTPEKDIHQAECSCGTYTRKCTYVNGKKNCTCMDAYEDRWGECTLCFCTGYNSMRGCRFDDSGFMICNCLRGFAQQGTVCKECDCGKNGSCSLYGSWKTCTCDKGYEEREGVCKECDCGKSGLCNFYDGEKTCYCSKGYSEFQGTCKACECGDNADCRFNSRGEKVCTCRTGYGMNEGRCAPCGCGKGIDCTFDVFGVKRCQCPKGYADDSGTCKACDCGLEKANCTFLYNIKSCMCPAGYEENLNVRDILDRSCKDIDECLDHRSCPDSTDCVNTPGSYDCVCKEGYEARPWFTFDPKKDGCQDINECETSFVCRPLFMRCINTPGSYKCVCVEGYHLTSYNTCESTAAYRPWRTASIVVGCLLGAIISGLLIAVLRKCDT